jgi:hypothetical protein
MMYIVHIEFNGIIQQAQEQKYSLILALDVNIGVYHYQRMRAINIEFPGPVPTNASTRKPECAPSLAERIV